MTSKMTEAEVRKEITARARAIDAALEQGQRETAITLIQKAINDGFTLPEFHFNLAVVYALILII